MFCRLFALALAVVLTLPAAKKNVATAKAENEDLTLTVTLHIDPADIKEMLGDDLGGHYFVADVTIEPKYTKDIVIDHDDFYLRTDKDGERTRPYAASQIAGSGALIVGHEQLHTASPGWQNTQIPVVRNGAAASAPAAPADGDKPKAESPLKKTLESKVLPQGKTTEPIHGLLYFPMEKQKMKDLELVYGTGDNRIRLRFKP